jgi:arylsulfatase A-like enzyme
MNVVLILVDALRPDHLGCYGYGRNTSPNIDSLAHKSVLFEQAIAHASYTLPSMKSIFASAYSTGDNLSAILSEMQSDYKTLPQCFKEGGYATGAVIGNFVLTRSFIHAFISKGAIGFDKGFDVYDDALDEREPNERGEKTRSAESVAKSAIGFIDRNAEKRFFLYVHFMDCHAPYAPPERFRQMFLNDSLFDGNKTVEISDLNFGVGKIPNYAALNGEKRVDYYVAGYDGAIRYVDENVGKILNELKRLHIDKNTIVVLVADHGEAMGEHNTYFCHGLGLYDDTIRVPLIIHHPKLKAKRIGSLVRLVDFMPTLLELNGIAVPKEAGGKSMMPLIKGETRGICGEAFSAIRADLGFRAFETMLYAVREQRWKLIQKESFKKRHFWRDVLKKIPLVLTRLKRFGPFKCLKETSKQVLWMLTSKEQPDVELYDLEKDPLELNNIAAGEAEQVKRLSTKLEKWKKKILLQNGNNELEQLPDKDKETIKARLRSLGYM